jgi:hypothetical protein
MTYDIDRDRGVVFIRFGERQPSLVEWRSVMDDILKNPAFRTGLAFVSDRRFVEGVPSTAMVRLMSGYAEEHRDEFGACRFAVVTPAEKPVQYGMTRMMQTTLEIANSPLNLRLFTDMDEAIRWATTATVEP